MRREVEKLYMCLLRPAMASTSALCSCATAAAFLHRIAHCDLCVDVCAVGGEAAGCQECGGNMAAAVDDTDDKRKCGGGGGGNVLAT
jgi:hypothetical protein